LHPPTRGWSSSSAAEIRAPPPCPCTHLPSEASRQSSSHKSDPSDASRRSHGTRDTNPPVNKSLCDHRTGPRSAVLPDSHTLPARSPHSLELPNRRSRTSPVPPASVLGIRQS